MTQRQIDLALLAGIGLLLVAILVLALSAAPTPGRGDIVNPLGGAGRSAVATRAAPTASVQTPATRATTSSTASPTASPAVSPTAPTATPTPGSTPDAAQGAERDAPTASRAVGDGPSAGAPAGSSDASSAGTAPSAEPQTTTESAAAASSTAAAVSAPTPGAASERTLERVGFAFVTGSVGACGEPLQPWQHVAVSRDLLDRYGCGATVEVALAESVAGRERVVAQIGDTMGAEITGAVNIFVAPGEPALEYGVTEGTLRAVGSP